MTTTTNPRARRATGHLVLALALLTAGCGTRGGSQRTFGSPEEALDSLVKACADDDTEAIVAIFGEEYRDYFASEDPSADRQARGAFATAATEQHRFEPREDGGLVLVVGSQEWPAPVPLVEEGGRWRFDTAAGYDEMLARRIGRNELDAIALLRGIVDAQHAYANVDWDGDGRREFARLLLASDGAYDGLYWAPSPDDGVPPSPLEAFIESERDYAEGRETGDPWRGYHVKLLLEQGPAGPGGARSYVVGDHLTGGFAAIAAPAQYGRSGIMTFLVGPNGQVLEKDLGPDSLEQAIAVTAYDPDEGWSPVN